ncbi:MAG: class I SAM-dependent methyltransferase [bacterium]
MNDFIRNNREMWDEMAEIHRNSYDEIKTVLSGKSIIKENEKNELGDIRDKALLHIQCHIGTDSISLAYEGAHVTGTDFSEKSIDIARELAVKTNSNSKFIVSDNSELTEVIDSTFDIVYLSRGVLCWNSDLYGLFRDLGSLLKPGGFVYVRDTHPVLMTIDEEDASVRISMDYFHNENPVKWDDNADYSAEDRKLSYPSYEWIWSVSDIINAASTACLRVEFFNEFDHTFYKTTQFMKQNKDGYWHIPGFKKKIPLMFSMKAIK